MTGHFNIRPWEECGALSIFAVPGQRIGDFKDVFLMAIIGFTVWTMLQFFKGEKKLSIILRTVAGLFLYYFSVLIIVGFILAFAVLSKT